MRTFQTDEQATAKFLFQHLAACMTRDSVVAWMSSLFAAQGGVSPGMTQCIVPRLIDQFGGPTKFMSALINASDGNVRQQLKLLSIGVAKQCAAAGVR